MFNLKSFLFGSIGLFILAACEVPVMLEAKKAGGEMTGAFEVTLPAVILVRLETGEEDFLTGTMVGHISGKGTMHLSSEKTGTCTGNANPKGKGTMLCSNGMVIQMDGDKSSGSKMSGVEPLNGVLDTTKLTNNGFTQRPNDPTNVKFVSAFGWGKMANDAAVRPVVNAEASSFFD